MNDDMKDIFSINDSGMDNIFSVSEDLKPSIKLEEKEIVKEEPKHKKKDKILIIQLILLLIWALLTVIIYFFGYDLFEPFINVS